MQLVFYCWRTRARVHAYGRGRRDVPEHSISPSLPAVLKMEMPRFSQVVFADKREARHALNKSLMKAARCIYTPIAAAV
jgi:hypothetical protein